MTYTQIVMVLNLTKSKGGVHPECNSSVRGFSSSFLVDEMGMVWYGRAVLLTNIIRKEDTLCSSKQRNKVI